MKYLTLLTSLTLLLLAAGCFGDDEAGPAPTTAVPEPAPTETTESEATNVVGQLQIGFRPYGDNAEQPEPPIDVTLIIQPTAGGAEVRYTITDPAGAFALSLPAGEYTVAGLEIEAPNMGDNPFRALTEAANFKAPSAGCVYIGRIFYIFYRLPPGSPDEQAAVVADLLKEAGRSESEAYFTHLAKGGIIGDTFGVDVPDVDEGVEGSERCPTQLAEF